ncbi:MAG: LysR family transcriptional regulator [Candidatus Nitrohelix vancouverensis]|uniref:LysR family transcriptional regulator n=1 Tax=Candidatus Nitrohelix vancouverensis TaxID=2705534 RepID=A0A7T0C0C2_9BACT|nr:MAG: LysR family transcriptional regulator [Candidatus Nitrohelix vancouverensis]
MASRQKKRPYFNCRPRIRVSGEEVIALGPGKADLLEAVDQTGSISQAARSLKLSYRRAWDMIHTMNQCFTSPLVAGAAGGKGGGGASLTPMGRRVVASYRAMEAQAESAIRDEWKSLQKMLKTPEA